MKRLGMHSVRSSVLASLFVLMVISPPSVAGVHDCAVLPNHPEALLAITRLEKMVGGKLPQRAADVYKPKISSYCFFDRALRFQPEQPEVRFSYAIYLHQKGKYAEALDHYKFAETAYEENPFF